MKVLTIEGFGGERGDEGYIYDGSAWLFRFVVSSPDKFFRLQLPYAIQALGIDPRQIYELSISGIPGRGLYDVRMYVSFEEDPTDAQIEDLRGLTPADFEPNDFSSNLETRLREMSPAAKKELLKKLRQKGTER